MTKHRFPFPIVGINTDDDSSFINESRIVLMRSPIAGTQHTPASVPSDWIEFDELHQNWQGQNGGKATQADNRKFELESIGKADDPLRESGEIGQLG